ncbi:MAG: T9SS type A sorting domain-containing protein, partial [Saprospiraceae bacterium]
SNILNIKSNLVNTDFEIFNSSGKSILKGKLINLETQVLFNQTSGLYFLKYINSEGHISNIKFIKF